MFIKLAKSASQLALPICAATAPFSTAFLLSTDAHAQTTINRYTVQNPYSTPNAALQPSPVLQPSQPLPLNQARPIEIRPYTTSPGNTQFVEAIPRQVVPPRYIAPVQGPRVAPTPVLQVPQAHAIQIPAPQVQAQQIYAPQIQAPQLQQPANFADVQVVGRGLGTPGLITSGAAERMQQSGLVVEEFRPPQPRVEDISLDGLPPEARRQFYQQLDLPEGARVMSARVVTADQQVAPPQDPRSVAAPTGSASPSVSSEPVVSPANREVDSAQPEPTATSSASSELVQELANQNIALLKEIRSIHERLEKLEQAYHLLEVQMIQVKENSPATIEPATEEQRIEPDSAPLATEPPATEQSVDDKPAAENDAATGKDKAKEKAPEKKKKNKKVAERIEV